MLVSGSFGTQATQGRGSCMLPVRMLCTIPLAERGQKRKGTSEARGGRTCLVTHKEGLIVSENFISWHCYIRAKFLTHELGGRAYSNCGGCVWKD